MPYHIEAMLDQPIIIASARDPFDLLDDLPEMMEAAAAAAYEVSTDPYIIYDFSQVDEMDMDEFAGGFMNMQQGVPGSVADDNSHILMVGVGFDWDIIAPVLEEDDLGETDVPTFGSVSEALEFIQMKRSGSLE